MGRPFYPHEADDPDLDWLVTNFLYERPNFVPIEAGSLPLMLLPYHGEEVTKEVAEEIADDAAPREVKPTPATK